MKENFLIKIETWHKPDMGQQDNVSIVVENLCVNCELHNFVSNRTVMFSSMMVAFFFTGSRSRPRHLEEGGGGVHRHRRPESGGAKGELYLNKIATFSNYFLIRSVLFLCRTINQMKTPLSISL